MVAVGNLEKQINNFVGYTSWLSIEQDRIDAFADASNDRQFIHTDPALASATQFGGTIAHGFLILSLLSKFAEEAALVIDGTKMGMNYGFDSVRFLHPVRSGDSIRARLALKDAKLRTPGMVQMTYDVTIEIAGEEKPALSAVWHTVAIVD